MNKKGEIQVADIKEALHGGGNRTNIEDAPNNDDLAFRCSIFDKHNPGFELNCFYCGKIDIIFTVKEGKFNASFGTYFFFLMPER